jgi:hypothetical protein
MPLRLVQLLDPCGERFVAAATDSAGTRGRRVLGATTVFALANAAIAWPRCSMPTGTARKSI